MMPRMPYLFLFLWIPSAFAAHSEMTIQHFNPQKLYQAVQFFHTHCEYTSYQHGTINNPKDKWYTGYRYIFTMDGDAREHRECLIRVRRYVATHQPDIDTFLLIADDL